jgi:ABC-type multidrug transport system ATPase subunit
VSHFLAEIQDIAENIVFIDEGSVVHSGPLVDLLKQAGESSLERAVTGLYGRRTKEHA